MLLRSRRVVMLLLMACGIALILRPVAALSSSSAVLINEFMPNTGADTTMPEWVEFFNPNPFAVDVSGWKIVDDTISHPQTTISAGSVMQPNSLLVVFLTTNIGNGINHTADHRSVRALQCSMTIRIRVLCNSRSLLNERVLRTRFAHHCRNVLFNRSI